MSNGWTLLHNKGTDAVNFIDIIEGTDIEPRTSTLMVSKNTPGFFRVIGNLPHNYMFQPKTQYDRDRLVRALQEIDYS